MRDSGADVSWGLGTIVVVAAAISSAMLTSSMRDPSDPIEAGEPGGSAAREYERRRDIREMRIKRRVGERLGGIWLAATDEPKTTQAWARGAAGERQLAEVLSRIDGVRVLHDRCVPGRRGNIDHLITAPAGLFVVDAKLYAGTIRVRDVGGLLRRDERLFIGGRDRSELADGMRWQVEAVRRVLDSNGVSMPVEPVLCFVHGEWPLFRPPTLFRGVHLEGMRSIRKLVTRDGALDAVAIDRVTRILAVALPSAA